MAEIIGSIAAIIQLADYGMAFAQTLSRFARQAGSAIEEVDRFAAQVRAFSQVVIVTQSSLYQHCSQYEESPVVAFILERGVLDDLSDQSGFVTQRLRAAGRKVEAMKSRFRYLTILKWVMGKPAVVELFPEMESVKNSIGLILATLHMEMMLINVRRTPASSTEEVARLQSVISSLKEVVKIHLETIERLQHQLDRLHRRDPAIFVAFRHQEALAELGRQMMEETVAPAPQPSDPSPEGSPEPSVSSMAGRAVIPPPAPSGPLREDLSLHRTVPGYIQAERDQPRITAASVSSTLDGNVISAVYMRRLGLAMNHLRRSENMSRVILVDNEGVETECRSFGTAIVTWMGDSDETNYSKAMRIPCDVLDYGRALLVFGKEFIVDNRRNLIRA